MSIQEHIKKDNFHHAYLIEGAREETVAEILVFLQNIGVKTTQNADVVHMSIDSFKIDDARNLKAFSTERANTDGKKIFIVSTNSFLLEAQNSLLKMFEEPIENTHFFLIVPDASALLKTFVSRFYFIPSKQNLKDEFQNAEKFIFSPLSKRIDFIKELLVEAEDEDEEGNEIAVLDSARSKALKFLNALEARLHDKFLKNYTGSSESTKTYFTQIFKVRKFLRMPGSSTKTLLESVALILPNFPN